MLSGSSNNSSTSQSSAGQEEAAIPTNMIMIIEKLFERINKRDRLAEEKRREELKQWRDEQAERDRQAEEKRREELKQWRDDQSKRDREQAERDKILQMTLQSQTDLLSKLIDAQNGALVGEPRRPPHHPSLSSNMKTPVMTRQSYGRSGAASHSSTPQVAGSMQGKSDRNMYIEASQRHEKLCKEVQPDDLIEFLGADWKSSWDSVNGGDFKEDIDEILHSYASKCDDDGLKMAGGKVGEKTYQAAFGVLAEAVQSHLSGSSKIKPGMYWYDTHNMHLKCDNDTTRKPDGGFTVSKRCSPSWQNLAVVVEIKGDELKNDSHWIRGQVLCDFRDMSQSEPRRFMVGLAVARHGSVRVYLYTPGRIYSASLGCLPLTAGDKAAEGASEVVAFLLLLHKQLAVDSGYLTRKGGIYSSHLDCSELADASKQEKPYPKIHHMCKDTYGRHRQLNAQQTWVYPVQYEAAGEKGSAFFKFQWGFKNDDEAAVHEFLLARKVPHVPKLRFSTHVTAKGPESDDWVCRGEAMLIADVGRSIIGNFDGSEARLSDAEIINIFAGYVHTLIAAAAVDADNRYVLHRDISTGNLMIKNDKSPYIIDWGYGRLCVKDEKRLLSDKQMVGTTIYMGIRILNGYLSRSVIDDLESLFLVLCHCLWLEYGKENRQYVNLWVKRDMGYVMDCRGSWLMDSESLFSDMECPGEIPEALKLLVLGMYKLLFPSSRILKSKRHDVDPRLDTFNQNEWLKVFEEAAEHAHGAPMPCLEELRNYVSQPSNWHTPFSCHTEATQPCDKVKANEQSIPETPTRHGSKRQVDSLVANISKKPRL